MKVGLDKWYRPKVDKEEFKQLCEKSDWADFKVEDHVLQQYNLSQLLQPLPLLLLYEQINY